MARRRTYWLQKDFSYLGVAAASNATLVDTATLHKVSEDPTIIRMIGRLIFQHERDSGGFVESMRSNMWLGIMCQHEAVATQSPRTKGDDEQWMWTGFMAVQSTFVEYPSRQFDSNTVIAGSLQSRATQHIPTGVEHVDIDSRSMRKAPQPCRISLHWDIVENLTETGAAHFLSGYIRFLIKE